MAAIRWMRLRRFGGRRSNNQCRILLTVTLFTVALLYQFAEQMGDLASMTSSDPADLSFLRNTRDLANYIDDILNPLIEPSSSPCKDLEVQVLALVTSAPSRVQNRLAIRRTWGQKLPTVFFLGLEDDMNEQLSDNYVEAKQYSDLVIFEFWDSYHNLTLKTALMLQWAARHCAHAQFVLKTDDDVLVNPWMMRQLVNKHADDQLVGFKKTGFSHRSKYNKWYLPQWLYPHDIIPEWLSGTGYLVNGKYLKSMSDAAYRVPLINLEDVFFTLLVAKQALGLNLTHEEKLSPYKPLVPLRCAYWDYALVHSFEPGGIDNGWEKVLTIAKDYESGKAVCEIYRRYFSFFSYYLSY